jgi:hypothetical protein
MPSIETTILSQIWGFNVGGYNFRSRQCGALRLARDVTLDGDPRKVALQSRNFSIMSASPSEKAGAKDC